MSNKITMLYHGCGTLHLILFIYVYYQKHRTKIDIYFRRYIDSYDGNGMRAISYRLSKLLGNFKSRKNRELTGNIKV